MTTRIKLRRDTAANWTSNDPVLALGEAGYDTTNNQLRVGDGTTAWSGLETIGGTGNKITAQKTYSDNYEDSSAQTFTYTTGSIAVQMGNDRGLYLDDLLSRLSNYFDGDLEFPYNYSNVSLVINPDTTNLSTTVTSVISQGGTPRLYTITLATTNPGPIVVDDIDFNYTYINTIGLDTVNDYFGMATGDDDIDIRSGRDITLDAADDVYISGGNEFDLRLVNLDNMSATQGINIITETTSSNYTWKFRFDGNLQLPEGLSLPTKTNTGYDYGTTLTGPTLRLSNDSGNQVIVTGPATTENNPSAQRIVIQGQRGFGVWGTSTYTVGEGGDVYIWGGTGGESENWYGGRTGGSGGDVKLRGGQGQDHDGGYVRIEGGNTEIYNNTSTGYGGFVEITGGDVVGVPGDPSDPGKGGDVRITGGRARSASTLSGVVQVITGGTTNPDVGPSNTWEFGNDGTLTLPSDGIIQSVDNNGRLRSQLRLDEGSDITRLSGWSSPDSQSFTTSDWTTGTYTNNAGAGVIEFTGAETIISWLNANNYADRFFFTVNGGPQMESTGWGGGVSDITFNVATPPETSPTTVTSFSIYYQFESRLDIDTDDQEFYILSTNNNLYLQTRQAGNIQLNSVEDLDLVGNGIVNLRNNSTSTGIQIRTDDGDHIWNFGVDGTLTFPVLTIATLPSANPAGQRAFISDGESSLAWGVTVGSTGTTTYPVWSDGSDWKIG